MAYLQGNFTHPTTKQLTSNACLLLDDVVVSLRSQIAAIHFAIYISLAEQQTGADAVYRGHNEAQSPLFSLIQLAAIPAGTLDAQIRTAAYQFLQVTPDFMGWVIVP